MPLFTSPEIALAGWVHYLAFDLFVGAWEVRTARREAIPHLLVLPCLVLTFLFGPVGFLLFLGLRAARPSLPAPRRPEMSAAPLFRPARRRPLRRRAGFAATGLLFALSLAVTLAGRGDRPAALPGREHLAEAGQVPGRADALFLTLAFFARWLPRA